METRGACFCRKTVRLFSSWGTITEKSIQTYGAGTSPWFRDESFSDKERFDLPLLPRGVGCGDLSVGIDELKARPNAILNSSQKR
jgi:hypothetical protein